VAERNRTVVSKDAVYVEGLKEVQAGFGKVARKVEKAQFKRAGEHVVGVARGKMTDSRTGTAASALRSIASTAGASIAYPAGGPGSGGDSAGYYPWLDFGGGSPVGRGVTHTEGAYALSFRRGFIKEGRYLYPAISDSKAYLMDVAAEAVEDAAKSEQFTVRGR
jgi:hypothetical protein